MRKRMRVRRVPAWLLALLLVLQSLFSATPASANISAVSATGNGNVAGQGASNPYFSVQFTTGAGFNVGSPVTLTFPDPMLVTGPNQLAAADVQFGVNGTFTPATAYPNISSAGGRQSLALTSPVAASAGTTVTIRLAGKFNGSTFMSDTVINPTAAGTYNIGVSTPAEAEVMGNYVVAAPPAPAITLTPNSVPAGYAPNTALTVVGSNTHFAASSTTLAILNSSNMDMQPMGTTLSVTDATHATISLGAGLAAGSYTVRLTTGSEQVTAALTVTPPTITLTPNSITAGYAPNTALAVVGSNTHFAASSTTLAILNSSNVDMQPMGTTLTVTDATHATVSLWSGLAAGSYTVRLTTGAEQVTAALTVAAAPAPSSTLTPNSVTAGYAPNTALAVVGSNTHFAAGSTTLAILNSSNVDMQPMGTSLSVTDATHATISLGAGLAAGSYTVQLTTGTEQVGATLTVATTPPPTITLTPNSVAVGYANNTPLSVVGSYTHFAAGTTTVTVLNSSNVALMSAATVTVTDATHATVSLAAGLAVGSYTVQLTTGNEQVTAPLTVVAPTITLTPSTLMAGYAAGTSLAVAGSNTHFVAGSTTLTISSTSSPNVTGASTLTVTDATHATVNLAAGLAAGNYTVQLNTNGEQVSAALTVVAPPASISLSPNPVGAGYPNGFGVSVIGTNTHFATGVTTLSIRNSSNADVTGATTLTVVDATHATVNLAAGLQGKYTVHLISGSEDVSTALFVGVPPDYWPVCATVTSQNCIQQFNLNGSPAPSTLLLHVWSSGDLQIQVLYQPTQSSPPGNDLVVAGSPVSASSTIRVTLNVGTIDPIALAAVGDITAFSYHLDSTNGNTISFDARPRPASVTGTTSCAVGACGTTTTQADIDFGGVVVGVLGSLPQPAGLTPDQVTAFNNFRTNIRGAWIANNAQAFSLPYEDYSTHAFLFDVAGPYLTKAGPVNNGVFTVFLPNSLLTNVWGIADPTTVTSSTLSTTRRDGSTITTVNPTVSQTTGGVIVQLGAFTYPNPSFSIVPR